MESKSLNKYIAETGFCSRRQADTYIEQSRVTINGVTAVKGNRVNPGDVVKLDGELIAPATKKRVYIALNKPVGVTCTTDTSDPDNIIDFLDFPERIFPIGRLDKMSEGLLLLTNDGDIVNKILRSRNNHEKEYIVSVNKVIIPEFIEKMGSGVPILDTITKPCYVERLDDYTFKIILTQGLNRQIRRMCAHLGYHVRKLVRVRIMHITLGDLPSRSWRYLTEEEMKTLNMMVQDSDK
ncbi:MAG: 23S rRNA pseudouridine(2604) synthase RluF [Saprospiraceae bacterium]|nr:23S rRNA pseudouridine(2604) synthase RluF [Saprospiraceae bacterium]